MRIKKRYMLFTILPKEIPTGAKILFRNDYGYVIKADLKTALRMREGCVLISGSVRKLKHPKLLNRGKTE